MELEALHKLKQGRNVRTGKKLNTSAMAILCGSIFRYSQDRYIDR